MSTSTSNAEQATSEQATSEQTTIIDMLEKVAVLGTRLKRRIGIDRKMIERRDSRIADLVGMNNELESIRKKNEARTCMELSRLVNILENVVDPVVLDKDEETILNPLDDNF